MCRLSPSSIRVVITHVDEYRQFSGELKLLERRNDWLYDVEVWLTNDRTNENNWRYPVNRRVADMFAGAPLLTAYVMGGKVVGDGHNFAEYTDPETGEPRGDFRGADAERIVGSLSEDPNDIRIEESDGDTWIVGRGTLWEWYCGELCEQIRDLAVQGRTMPVSIETLVSESHMDGDVEVMDNFIVLGATILGVHVAPAVTGARITALRALESDFKALKLRAASYADKPDSTEPKEDQQDGANAAPKSLSKGVTNTLTMYTKRQLAELGKRFSGYTLLGAQKDEETGAVTVKMRDDTYGIYSYAMQSEAETIAPERILATFARVDLGDGVFVDVSDMTEPMSAEIRSLCADKATLGNELDEARKTIKTMQDAEAKRRVEAAKAAVLAALARFNANREDQIEECAIEAIIKKAEDGCYSECINADGCWEGEAVAERDCLAECARQEMTAQEKKAAMRKNAYVWDKHKAAPADDGSISGLLARKGIR